ncbi:MAG: cytochrome c biogenesis protein ResB [Lachnospiraceae bacterium]|nr:cytochrome c biogenesis protein ResB [Lachnospiraceae bacterium]
MSPIKKIWKFISSMQFAIILLVLLAAVCSVASFVTQGQTYAWYAQTYSERTAAVIVALHLDDAFHSWWFIAITAFLCMNLLLCNILKFPQNLRRMKNAGDAEKHIGGDGNVQAEDIRDPEKLFEKLHFGKITRGSEDRYLFAAKNHAGYWGAWVCHLGILLVILGFGLGQMTKQTYTAYGVPGQSRAIGETGYIMTIDRFEIGHRADDTVEQYTSELTVREAATGNSEHAEISVNNPATMFGLRFYQNSTGWAAKVHVDKDGEPLQEEIVCAGDYLRVKDKEDLVIYLNAFYPDFVLEEGVGPRTASSEIKNPAYLYSVYYMDSMLGMNALLESEELTIDEYTVTFSEPQNFTLIQIKKDHFTWLALVGGLVTMLGLILAFYMQPAQMWAVKQENGLWKVCGTCRKGGAIFREQFLEAAGGKE